ncbi:transcriptional repressor CTCF [Drosophila guanche]|uniref:Blast:Transcriptional repressor CTCF n=1 Tax=Drosophila guanche TaxID=7266 RepID=A0A3B0J6Y7_DROGU|nr:transcriptional repressor CTCF [Drosophila guanche]SPP77515.1 blast:Transcriptional repressor CTCF [Drosophila guanche]
MAKSSRKSSEDVQSFLKSFHKEIEDGSDDKVVHKILKSIRDEDGVTEDHEGFAVASEEDQSEQDEDYDPGEEEDDGDKYFIDDDGNCYIKTTQKQKELLEKLKNSAKKHSKTSPAKAAKPSNKVINLRPAQSLTKRVTRSAAEPKPISARAASAAAVVTAASTSPKLPEKTFAKSPRGRPKKAIKLPSPKLEPKSEALDIEREMEELVADTDVAAAVADIADNSEYIIDNDAVEALDNVADGEVYEFDDNPPEDTKPELKITNRQFLLKPVPTVEKKTSKTHHFSCSHCSYTTNKKFLISRHNKTHETEFSYICSICDRGFKTNVGLVNHVNTHLGNKPHKCKHCESAFVTSGELIRHTRYKHTKEKPHKCTECSYASVELTKLRRHMTCHTGERPYQCPHCTYASQDMFKLKRHLVVHTGEKKYQCDICKSRFTQSNSLKAHKLIHSVVDKPVFQCSQCPTTCGRKADLRLHVMHMHKADKPIPCKRCGQNLPDRYQYKLHIKTHEGERCYRCNLCEYASVSKRHLDSHMLIHLDEKPFACEMCPQTFRQRQLLRRHMNLVHNEQYQRPEPREKVHSCPNCPRTFTHKGNLMRHMESHDDSKNTREERLKLKMGRNVRLQPDGSIVTLVNERDFDRGLIDMDEEDEENFELADVEPYNYEDEILDAMESNPVGKSKKSPVIINTQPRKSSINQPVIINRRLRSQGGTKTFHIKEEPNTSEFTVELDGDEGQVMVVELVNGEEEVVVKREPKASKINAANCFGFEEDDAEYVNYGEQDTEMDGTSQEFLQLMDMIEQDT